MIEIFSKKSGSDGPNQEVKRFLAENRQTIDRIANHLTQGAWSDRNPQPVPSERQTSLGFVAVPQEKEVEARLRISPNNRVVLFDVATSRQISFIGVIRGPSQDQRFVLATKANGFTASIEDDLEERLRHLDGSALRGTAAIDELGRAISVVLGLPTASDDADF